MFEPFTSSELFAKIYFHVSPKWDTQWNKINMRACWIALGALAVLVGVRQLEPRKVVMLGISMSSFQRQELGQERQLRDRERLSRAGSMSMGTGLLHVAPHRLTLHCARAARVLRSLRKTSVPALAESERCSRVSYEGLLLKIRIASLCAHGTVSRVCLAGMCRRSPGPARPRARWSPAAEGRFRPAH